jgi:DNA polymerase III delta subunit
VRQGWLKAKKRSVHCYQVESEDLKQFFQNPPASLRKRMMAIDPQVISYLVG